MEISKKVLLLLAIVLVATSYQFEKKLPVQDRYDNIPRPVDTLDGNYVINRIGNTRPNRPYQVQIRVGRITVKACNTLTASFRYNSATNRWSVGQFGSTYIACPAGNQDNLISNAFRRAVRAYRRGNNIQFEDSRRVVLITLSDAGSSTVDPRITNIQGSFAVQAIRGRIRLVRRIAVSIFTESQTLVIKGCNFHSASYEYDQSTRQWSINRFRSTRAYCQDDQDRYVIRAISTATQAYRTRRGSLIFADARGAILRLRPTRDSGLYNPDVSSINDYQVDSELDEQIAEDVDNYEQGADFDQTQFLEEEELDRAELENLDLEGVQEFFDNYGDFVDADTGANNEGN